MTAQERRQAVRALQRYLVRFDDAGEMRLAFSHDVSHAGMFLKTRQPPLPGTGLRMLVRTSRGTQRRSGVVVWTRLNFRRPDDLWLSSIGLGTRGGEGGSGDDFLYRSSIPHALDRGVNVFDTAIRYRSQLSERTLGAALARRRVRFSRVGRALGIRP